MSLPKLDIATFEMVQPSTKNKILYRPFRVKEEKILLMAKESGEKIDIINAVKQVISNCIINEDFDVNNVPLFDLEYFFIKLRASSVGNICKFSIKDSDDGIEYEIEVNLDNVEVEFPENIDKKIMITDDIGVMMKYPDSTLADRISEKTSSTELLYELVVNSIDFIFTKDDTYSWSDSTAEEREEFLDNLSGSDYVKITEFFSVIPRINHIVNYNNSEGKEKKVIFRSLDDFFDLG